MLQITRSIYLSLALLILLTVAGQGFMPLCYAEEALQLCIADQNYPYVFFDQEGQREGFDIDMLKALNLPYKIQFVSVDVATGLAMLDSNKCQMLLSSTLITKELEKRYLFSKAHLQADLHALVLMESPLQDIELLNFSILGVLKGSSAEKFAFNELKNSTIIALRNGDSLLELLRQGEIEAILGNKMNLEILQNNYDDMHMLNPALKTQAFGYVFSKKHHALCDEISSAVDILHQEGTLTKLYNTWFAKSELKNLSNVDN